MPRILRPTFRTTLSTLLLGLTLGTSSPALFAEDLPFAAPARAGKLSGPPRNETSGITASRRAKDMLWVHDDSGGEPVLYAVGTDGASRGALRITGVRNKDWEDVASFELGGKAWLLIGDIGDNDAKRPSVQLHLIEEPSPEQLAAKGELAVRPTATWTLTYEDGPRDCESLAVDPVERAIYVLSKREMPPRLYRIAMPAALNDAEVSARFVGNVPHLPQPTSWQAVFKNHLGAFRGWPCAMDFAADGSRAVVLTYGDVLVFPRKKGESWADALAREPLELPPHGLEQAEAACFSRDGTAIYVASEDTRKLLRYDRQK